MLPKTVDIFGTIFTLERVDLGPEKCGETTPFKRLIQIDSALSDGVAVETFYHELMHAILAHTGLEHVLDDGTNEAVAQGVGIALAYIIANNNLPYMEKPSG